MKQELKEVSWRRSYPKIIIGKKEKLLRLKRKNWGFRLIYDVYLEEDDTDELIGTCHVMERPCLCEPHQCEICTCGSKFVVKELTAKSPKLAKRLDDVQQIVRECLCL